MRPRKLPRGWYPESGDQVRELLRDWEVPVTSERGFVSVIAPHAGWQFSGKLAFRTLAGLGTVDTVVIVGGHLGPGSPVKVWPEAGFETPLGMARADSELRSWITREIECVSDRDADNSVEVLLPMVKHLLPGADVLGFRAPPSILARRLGLVIVDAARAVGHSVGIVGSTDLTHYGPSYRFTPRGDGPEALNWVRETNDARIIDTMMSMDADGIIEIALRESSACSPGAAATAVAYARESRAGSAVTVGYGTSYDTRPAESFVGYVGIGYRCLGDPEKELAEPGSL